MAESSSSNTRTFALVGHGGSGKTTLAEAILFQSKAVNRQGKVSDKNTVSDFHEDEKESGHSIDASLLHADYQGHSLQFIDAPGYPDFLGQALRSLDAADCAVVVVNAYDGVALNTRRLFHAAGRRGLPRLVVVNRCDLENVDQGALDRALAELCGTGAKPVTVPDEWGPSMNGVKSIFRDASDLKEGFVEAAVEADDALTEKYLEEGAVSEEDLKRAIPKALAAGTLIPVFHAAAEKGVGVTELLDFLAEYGPSPLDRKISDTEGNPIDCREEAPFSAVCFRVTYDRQAGKTAFIRVFGGILRTGDTIVLQRTGDSIRVGHLTRFQGDHRDEVHEAHPGDLVALTKVEEVEIGDTLDAPGHDLRIALRPLPSPMVGLAVTPKTRGDETKLMRELSRIVGADPCLAFERTQDTHELVVKGMSTLHLDIAFKRLAAAGVEVETAQPKVAYRETISASAEGHYRHKKQTGGAGQFGEVYLKVEPIERDREDPLDFVDEIFGGAIPKQFLPAIEKGIRQKMVEGVIAGYPVVGVRARITDGKYHDVDSKEIAFIIAGRNAFAEAVEKAKPSLLEPVMDVEIEIPSRFMGDISSDLNSRRARIQGMDSAGDLQIIKAQVPLAEMQTYSTQLRSITAGEGSFSMEFSRYDIVPANVAQQVIAKHKAEKKSED